MTEILEKYGVVHKAYLGAKEGMVVLFILQ